MKDKFQHFSSEPTKFCSNCSNHRSTEGGEKILINKGRNYRWMCAYCVKHRNQRRAA